MISRRRMLLAGAALAAAAAAGFAALRFRTDLAAARARLSRIDTASAMTRHGPVEYAVKGSGPPVLMIHGSGGGFDQALTMGGPLIDLGFGMIAPSRFGYPGTPLPADPGHAAQADALADLLDHLGIERLAIVGGSAGAVPAISFAIRHPDRCAALVALVPAVPVPGDPPMAPWSPLQERAAHAILGSDLLFWAVIKSAPGFAIRTLLATDPALLATAGPAERARVRAILDGILPVSARRDGLLNDARETGHALLEYGAIRAPTLALSLEDDLFGTARAARMLAATVPGAELTILPKGGHVWVGQGDEIFGAIGCFLRRIAGRRSSSWPEAQHISRAASCSRPSSTCR
jgi:2-hydroxy-6-oxonona-2,4-dienedioate hydrolase